MSTLTPKIEPLSLQTRHTSAYRHFFGYQPYKTNLKRSDHRRTASQNEQLASLGSVRRQLKFSVGHYIPDTEKEKLNTPSLRPTDSVSERFNETTQILVGLLDNLPTFCILLFTVSECDCGGTNSNEVECQHWKVGVVVQEEHHEIALSTILDAQDLSPETKDTFIVVLVGKYEFSAVDAPNRAYQDKPGPGSSLSHEDDHMSSVTLGGYVQGRT